MEPAASGEAGTSLPEPTERGLPVAPEDDTARIRDGAKGSGLRGVTLPSLLPPSASEAVSVPWMGVNGTAASVASWGFSVHVWNGISVCSQVPE